MKKSLRYVVITALVVAFAGLAIAGPVQQSDKVRIAVLNFENNSTWHYWGDHLGEAAADELVTQLFKTGEFSVIEREQLQAIMQEQNLGQSGRVNASTAAEIGKILGVQVILTGSITKFSIDRKSGGFGGIGGSYSEAETNVDIRMINTNTAEIVFAEEGEGKKRMGGFFGGGAAFESEFDAGVAQEALRPAIEDIVGKIADQADQLASIKAPVPAAQIVGANDGNVYIDRGENFGVTVGQRFDVYRVVDEIKDAQGNVLDRITEKVGVLEVTRVLSQSAICTIVEGEAAEGDTVQGQG